MFFILSKTISFFAVPIVDIAIILILSLVVKSQVWKRRLRWTGIGLLLFFSNPFIANEVMRGWETDATPFEEMRPYDLAIVLTGVTNLDIEPKDRVYFRKGADRVYHTVELYKRGLVKQILVSGKSGRIIEQEKSEADDLKDAMIVMGVNPAHISVEANSRNTHESAVEVAKLLDDQGITPSSCVLVTSAFHMRRSIACFRNEGLDIDTFSTDFYTYPTKYTPDAMFVPSADALSLWQRMIREWVGIVMYKLVGYA